MRDENKREQRTRVRYQLKNKGRFFGAVTVLFLLLVLFIVLLLPRQDSGAATITPKPIAEPASPTPTASPEPTASPLPIGMRKAPLLVVLDPGHGGRDPGAVSPVDGDVHETDIVLEVALQVRDLLETAGIPVLMTRETDLELEPTVNADLLARAQIANEADATLYVSIHINSYDLKQRGGADVNGMEIYYYQGTRPTYEMLDALKLSENLSAAIHGANGMPVDAPISRGLSVLRNTQMPAALVEIGYITNSADRKKIMDAAFLKQTASGISSGILLSLEQIGVDQNELTVLKKEQ